MWGGNGAHHQGHRPRDGWTAPAWAPGQWQYLHKSLLVDLQLRLWCLEGGGGEKAQEEFPRDLTLEAHLQERVSTKGAPSTQLTVTFAPSPTPRRTGKPSSYPHTPEHCIPGQAEDELRECRKVGSVKWSPLLEWDGVGLDGMT